MPNEIIILSSGSEKKTGECNIAISNGLLRDKYINSLDGSAAILNDDFLYIVRDRIKICLTGTCMMYTDSQIDCLEDIIHSLFKIYGVMKITLIEDYEEGHDKTFSDDFFRRLKNRIRTRWIKGE